MSVKKTIYDMAGEMKDSVREIDTNELKSMMDAGKVSDRPDGDKAILIDVRENDEREAGYIPDSVHIGRGVLERDIESRLFGGEASEEDLHRPIVCYCRGGHRSILACVQLREMGFTDVTSVSGGYREWSESGKPVQTP